MGENMTRTPSTHGRTDANQTAIVAALREIGASVVSLADIGNGCPDLLVGFRGVTLLLEVKDGSKPPSKRKLTPDEKEFFETWRGKPPRIVCDPDDAIAYVISETAEDDGIPI